MPGLVLDQGSPLGAYRVLSRGHFPAAVSAWCFRTGLQQVLPADLGQCPPLPRPNRLGAHSRKEMLPSCGPLTEALALSCYAQLPLSVILSEKLSVQIHCLSSLLPSLGFLHTHTLTQARLMVGA